MRCTEAYERVGTADFSDLFKLVTSSEKPVRRIGSPANCFETDKQTVCLNQGKAHLVSSPSGATVTGYFLPAPYGSDDHLLLTDSRRYVHTWDLNSASQSGVAPLDKVVPQPTKGPYLLKVSSYTDSIVSQLDYSTERTGVTPRLEFLAYLPLGISQIGRFPQSQTACGLDASGKLVCSRSVPGITDQNITGLTKLYFSENAGPTLCGLSKSGDFRCWGAVEVKPSQTGL